LKPDITLNNVEAEEVEEELNLQELNDTLPETSKDRFTQVKISRSHITKDNPQNSKTKNSQSVEDLTSLVVSTKALFPVVEAHVA
jgi:hypothetical protein